MFFFEKKNQKTFAHLMPRRSPLFFVFSADRLNTGFLVLFFKKNSLPSSCAAGVAC